MLPRLVRPPSDASTRLIGENNVGKVIPSARDLANAYRLFARGARARRIAEEALAAMRGEEIVEPDDLAERVRAYLVEHPEAPWDAAVAALLTDDGAH